MSTVQDVAESDAGKSPEQRVISEAKRRWKRCLKWESKARDRFLEDLRFANADDDNGYQWPNDIRQNRIIDRRPCLTINKTRQHNLQIINDAKQNKPGIAIKGTGNGATYEAAQIWEGLVRHIEYISNATVAYDTATTFQVEAGIGYWRVVTDYAGPDTLDQEIFIRRIPDPLTVFLDPDIREFDGSDARFGFIFEDVNKEEFDQVYPDYAKYAKLDDTPALGNEDVWVREKYIRVAEYYRKVEKKDELLSFVDSKGERQEVRKSVLPPEVYQGVKADPETQTRAITRTEVEWYFIVGDQIADKRVWPGQYIPIVRLVGEETLIDGEIDRKGHTRALRDPQRMYNYWSSSAVEMLSLQTKVPWIAPAETIEEYANYWETSNTQNHAYLPYKSYDENGQKLDPPSKPAPPMMAQGYLDGMKVAQEEMMLVSGQYQAMMGEPSNERSGKAINERQRQGDNATYHFIDNQGIAIRFTGKILLDLIPKIYDTRRTLRIIAEDGVDLEVQIDPSMKLAYTQRVNENNQVVARILNPNIGSYDVMADMGPSYATRRQEGFNALTQIITQAPNLTGIIGDILLRAGDFPMADEAAERLRRMVPPQALGAAPSAREQQLMAQVQNLTQQVQELLNQSAQDKIRLKGKDEMRSIDTYDAETRRMTALQKMLPLDAEGLQTMIHQLVMDTVRTQLQPILAANVGTLQKDASEALPVEQPADGTPQNPPHPEAQMGDDGNWYIPDHARPGFLLKLTKGVTQ